MGILNNLFSRLVYFPLGNRIPCFVNKHENPVWSPQIPRLQYIQYIGQWVDVFYFSTNIYFYLRANKAINLKWQCNEIF